MRAIQVSDPGGPERLEYRDVPRPEPGPGQALVRIEAIGVNFIDVYHRSGLYPLPRPFTPGSEAAGVVEAVGEGVKEFSAGDRIGYTMVVGAYAEFAVVPADKLVPLPKGVDSRSAAATLLQGMTAHYLTRSVHELESGQSALVHAAAGGVGGLLVQIAHRKGARVFATVSTRKLSLVPRGADAIIDYTTTDFEAEVMRLTGGAGVDVVYDSVGRTTFDKSVNCVGVRGMLALFGQSSGTVPPFDPSRLAKRGIFLTRPSLAHYSRTREELLWRARDTFEEVAAGRLHVRIDRELPLSQAAEAHRLLESRATVGKLLLIPDA
jgi:NADPH:quinone reductase